VLQLLQLLLLKSQAEWTEWPLAASSSSTPRLPSRDFIFPDQLPRLRKAMPIIPAQTPVARGCGHGKDFCEAVEDYPDVREIRQKVRGSLGKVEAQLVFSPLREDQVGRVRARLRGTPGVDPEPIVEDEDEIDEGTLTRQAFSSETPACDSQQSFVYPRTARNRGRQWRFVINVPGEESGEENFVQAVKVERCLREGETCNIASAGYDSTVCRQKYSYRRLLALGEDGEQYVDSFRFPSCCICFSQRTFYTHFELLRNAVDNTTLVPALEKRNSLAQVSRARTNPKDAHLRGGRSSQGEGGGAGGEGGEGGVSERSTPCKNRFCRSRRRPGMPRMQKRSRTRRKPRRRMSTPLKTVPQAATQVLLS